MAYATWVRRVLLGVLSRLAQRLVHPFCGSSAHRGYPVRVAVKGELNAGVPEEVLNVLRVRATREQQGSARMPQIMKAQVLQTRTLKEGFERASSHRALPQRCGIL